MIYAFNGFIPVVHESAFVHPQAAVTGNVIIGHGAIIHGATVGRNVLVGMNAVLMDRVEIGDESIIGALSFIKADEVIPPRSLVVGNPHKIIRQVSDEMLAWKTEGTHIYMQLPADLHATLQPCEPLREVPADRQVQQANYHTWAERKTGE